MAAITVCCDFVCVCVCSVASTQENKVWHCFHFFFPIFLPWNDGTGYHDLSFFECWILSQLFHSPLSPLFSSSLLSAIRVLSSAYLRLLIFLPAILIPACDSSQIKPHWPCWNHFRFVSKKSIPFLQRKETEIVKYMYIFDYIYIYIYIYKGGQGLDQDHWAISPRMELKDYTRMFSFDLTQTGLKFTLNCEWVWHFLSYKWASDW